ncbi:NAD-dependent epimerase/dehydratase family protein [Paenibacillus xanthanilyticus]|uniref:NAD-dependent epimerase/dehydratase family protein n=1 Tax=Paenibacillus xanthanilyticus TaxID=1783531 RepID=A0ABV8K5D1_9BACL
MKVILTGATGMVGEGVLHECLRHPDVREVLSVGRRPCGVRHSKLIEIVHDDLEDWSPIADRLQAYDACFFCLGISSVGKSEAEYERLTYRLTIDAAKLLAERNPAMTFCYVSGAGTDSTEIGRSMWARVKGRTENALLRLPFRSAYMFRPGYLHPIKGLNNAHRYYRYIGWLYPLLRIVLPQGVGTLRELALAMIRAAKDGYDKSILEVKDIRRLAKSADGKRLDE